jgi:hypothetical protein
MSEDELIADRLHVALEQWPHLNRAFGCLNCELIFAEPKRVAMVSDTVGRCPQCGSESVFDVAAALAMERRPVGEVLEQVEAIMQHIKDALSVG